VKAVCGMLHRHCVDTRPVASVETVVADTNDDDVIGKVAAVRK
jgi:hypothetical protein